MPVEQAVIVLPSERSYAGSKPRRKLLGLTLLERAVLTASGAGVRDFILAGEAGRGLEESAVRLGRDKRVRKRGLRVAFAALPDLPNSAGARGTGRPFWLIGGDLVFEAAFLLEAESRERDENETIHLASGGAAYSGISLFPGSALAGIADALAARGPDVATAESPFGMPGRSAAVDGPFCLRVDSPGAYRRAHRLVLNTARKPKDGFISRHFNRHISLFLTRGFLKTGVHPSVLSVVTLAIGLASGWFVSRGGYPAAALGGFLFDFASIFDGCDGEIARLTIRTSKFGGFLDVAGDAAIFVLFFLCLPLGLYRASRNPLWIWLGLLALISMGTFYLQLVRFMRKGRQGTRVQVVVESIEGSSGKPGFGSRLDALASKLAFIYRRDFFSTVAALAVMAGGAKVLMIVLAIFMPLEPVYMFFFARRHLRQGAPPGTTVA
jgi:phosphatidylglycerophosphate synthase